MVKVIILKEARNEIYNFIERGIVGKASKIVWASVYPGHMSWYRTKWSRNWCWVVRWVENGDWKYEHCKTYQEAKRRAMEIGERKEEEMRKNE
jgi:hypothetical protein